MIPAMHHETVEFIQHIFKSLPQAKANHKMEGGGGNKQTRKRVERDVKSITQGWRTKLYMLVDPLLPMQAC